MQNQDATDNDIRRQAPSPDAGNTENIDAQIMLAYAMLTKENKEKFNRYVANLKGA